MNRRIRISGDKRSVSSREAAALFIELGWGTPAQYSPLRMKRALAGCDIVVSARNEAGELVGLARALTDGAIDTRVLDVIVAPEYQRSGVGRALLKKVESLAPGTTVYFETGRKNFGFAKKCGYARRAGMNVFMKKTKG